MQEVSIFVEFTITYCLSEETAIKLSLITFEAPNNWSAIWRLKCSHGFLMSSSETSPHFWTLMMSHQSKLKTAAVLTRALQHTPVSSRSYIKQAH